MYAHFVKIHRVVLRMCILSLFTHDLINQHWNSIAHAENVDDLELKWTHLEKQPPRHSLHLAAAAAECLHR